MAFITGLLLLFLFNSSLRISSEDERYMAAFLKEWNISADQSLIHQTQETQVQFIYAVQRKVIRDIRHDVIPFDSVGIVRCYFNDRRGQCFDRALLLEKFYLKAGFKVRHIYAYFNEGGAPVSGMAFFRKKLSSHAMLEVKTKNGWMAIGTNSDWIGLQADGTVLSLPAVRTKLADGTLHFRYSPEVNTPFFEELHLKSSFRILYGIYSRHGEFLISRPVETGLHRIGIHKSPFPDYNLRMLLYNF